LFNIQYKSVQIGLSLPQKVIYDCTVDVNKSITN